MTYSDVILCNSSKIIGSGEKRKLINKCIGIQDKELNF